MSLALYPSRVRSSEVLDVIFVRLGWIKRGIDWRVKYCVSDDGDRGANTYNQERRQPRSSGIRARNRPRINQPTIEQRHWNERDVNLSEQEPVPRKCAMHEPHRNYDEYEHPERSRCGLDKSECHDV